MKIPQRYLLVPAKSIRVFLKRFLLRKEIKSLRYIPLSLSEQSERDSGISHPPSTPPPPSSFELFLKIKDDFFLSKNGNGNYVIKMLRFLCGIAYCPES
jgi:hypothetical protein